MSFAAAVLILASSLCWAGFDMARKRLAVHLDPVPAVIALMFGQLPLFLAMAFMEPWFAPQSEFWWPASASVVLNVFANVFFLRAVQLAPLSLAIPMLSFTPVFGALMGFLVLDERLSPRQIIGVLMVIVGALILQWRNGNSLAPPTVPGATNVRRGLALMMAVSALWSVTPVIDKIGLRSATVSFYAFYQCLGIAILLLIYNFLVRRPLQINKIRSGWRDLFLAIAVAAGALVTQFFAIQKTAIGIFEAMKRAVGLLAALAFGAWIFGEPITRAKIIGVALMGAGIALILL